MRWKRVARGQSHPDVMWLVSLGVIGGATDLNLLFFKISSPPPPPPDFPNFRDAILRSYFSQMIFCVIRLSVSRLETVLVKAKE